MTDLLTKIEVDAHGALIPEKNDIPECVRFLFEMGHKLKRLEKTPAGTALDLDAGGMGLRFRITVTEHGHCVIRSADAPMKVMRDCRSHFCHDYPGGCG